MIGVLSLLCWAVALGGHALLQPKILRLLHMRLASGWSVVLKIARTALPCCALGLCLTQPAPLGLLVWIGTFSMAGFISSGVLAIFMARRNVRMRVRSIIRT